jgi:carbamoyl-phosphate synthase large subunit
MEDIKILITGAGAPGIKGTLYSLKKNGENRKIKTVGVDIKKDVVGRYLCDKFHQICRPSNENFIPLLLEICEKEKIDVILPQVTDELFELAEHKKEFENLGTKICISNKKSILLSNNKYELLNVSKKLGLPTSEFYLVKKFTDLEKFIEKLGWPEKPVVIKPPVSSGMRGLRIIDEKLERKGIFYNEKPTSIYIKKDELKKTIGEKFPELLVTEFLPGKEYSVDGLTTDKTIIIPRSRDKIRTGITFHGTVEKNEEITRLTKEINEILDLEYVYGFQFKLDENNIPKIIESNPRIQGTMVLSTLAGANIIYGAVKYALGEDLPNFKIRWNTRLLRYWGGISVTEEKISEEII